MVQWLRLHIRCKGHGFDPWSGNQDFTCYAVQEKKKSKARILLPTSPAPQGLNCSPLQPSDGEHRRKPVFWMCTLGSEDVGLRKNFNDPQFLHLPIHRKH